MSKKQITKEKKIDKPSASMRATDDQRSQPANSPHPNVLSLQRVIGNQAVSGLIEGKSLPGSKLHISQPGDAAEQEADRVAEQVMKRPAKEALTSAPPRIQRRASDLSGPQQADPASVNQALSGPGNPLKPEVQQDMEGRFGRDFSEVRLHTDKGAARSADAVNAQAYTVENHIVFGPDQFAPETEGGRKLLAHELAHIIQQTGGGPNSKRVLARKLKVGLAGWGSNLFGDDDSQVIFTPSAEFETQEFSRKFAAASSLQEQVGTTMEGLTSGQYARTDLDVPIAGGQTGMSGNIPIKAGTKGVVNISVHANFDMDEKSNDNYEHTLICSWNVEAGLDGKLKIHTSMPGANPVAGSDAPFQLTNLNPAQDADMGYVQISPQYTSYQFTDIPNVQVSGGIEGDVKAVTLGGQVGVTLGNETTYPAGMLVRTFKLNFQVTDIPEPKGEVTFGPISALKKIDLKFPRPKRGKGQSAVSSAEEQKLIGFYQSLSEETKKKMIAGETSIALTGKASTTGDPAMNRELSNKRMENVKNILSQFVGNKAVFEYRSTGEYEAQTGNDVESDEERVVTVEIWDQVAEAEPGFNQGP